MSKWIRNYKPTEIDADEWGNILVLDTYGHQSIQQWQDYIEDGMQERGDAWMPLPQSDIPKTVSVTIEVGNNTYTIENNGFTIEVHDSRDPMGQPAVFETKDTITGILEAVDGILQAELSGNDEDEQLDWTALTVDDVRDFLDAEAEEGRQEAMKEHLNSLRGSNAESAIEAAYQKSRPWNKKKIGSYDVG